MYFTAPIEWLIMRRELRGALRKIWLVLAAALALSACSGMPISRDRAAPAMPTRPYLAAGYLSANQLPDSAKLLPPPPAQGCAIKAADEDIHRLYQRTRPFVEHGEPTCYPPQEPLLRDHGAYPSGHTAFGWGGRWC